MHVVVVGKSIRIEDNGGAGDTVTRTFLVTGPPGTTVGVGLAAGPGTTWVIDQAAKTARLTRPKEKLYQTADLSRGGVLPADVLGMNVRDQLLALKAQKAELEATEKVNGEMADKYTVAGGKGLGRTGDWEVWVGRKTGLPVKVSVEVTVAGTTTTRVYDSFDWAPATDAATFATAPPAGFAAGTILKITPPLPPAKAKD